MSVLIIKELEKHDEYTIVFPAFSLEILEHEVVAVHTSTNVRSALIKMFIGELPIANGEITVKAKSLKLSKREYFSHVGFLFLDEGLYERLSVKDNFSFFKKLYNSPLSIAEAMSIVQLETKKNKRLSELSYSEKRRVQMGRLLFQNPSLFIFEEPDQNVDLETKRIFIKLLRELKEKGKAILIITGNLESAVAATDRVYRLDETGLHPLDIHQEEEEPFKEHTEVEEKDIVDETRKDEEIIIQPVRFEKIPTKINDKIVLFDPPEIDYIESNDGQSTIYINGELFPSVFTMNELEKRLNPYGFFRCHRSYIVNLQKVREVVTWTRNSYTLVLGDAKKSSIPLSKTKMTELKEMLGLK